MLFGLGITPLVNSSVPIRCVHFLACCGFKSYGPDCNPTTDNEDRFWTHDQFAIQATILDLLDIESRNCIKMIGLCQ